MKAVALGFVLMAVGVILLASVPTPLPLIWAILIALIPSAGMFLIIFGFIFALLDT